jgi:predicted alpha/beta-hydrolase family hydrolase
VTALLYPAVSGAADAVLILGHGAGAGQRSPWMVERARDLSARGLDIVTFNFPYTEQGRSVPDRPPLLEACYRAVIGAVAGHAAGRRPLFIGGKSMGGRIATQVAAADPELPVEGLVLLGYPLHPPGQPAKRRDAHLPAITRPMLFVQGSRDTFGTPPELQPVLDLLPAPATLHVIDGGDHSLKLGTRNPARQAAVFDEVDRTIVEWIGARRARPPGRAR